MPVNILMPALSPTMEKGNLARWLKKEGDQVKAGDVIAEIETDKATMEYEAIDDGVLAKIVVPEGTADVPVNQLIAVLAQEGEDVKAAASAAGKAAPSATAKASESEAGGRTGCGASETLARAGCSRAEKQQLRRTARTASSRRRWRGGLRRTPAWTSPASRVQARTDASSRATSRRRNPARDLHRPRQRPWRRLRPTTRSGRCSNRAATRSSRTTTCARSSRGGWSRRSRPSRTST